MIADPRAEWSVIAPPPAPRKAVPVTIRTVMLATDLSAVSQLATDRAIEMASRMASHLVVINVIDERALAGGAGRGIRVDQLRRSREQALLGVAGQARDAGVTCEFLVWDGDVGKTIVAAAEAERADLVVVGSRGLDRAGRFRLGSVSDHVIHHAHCPVLVVRPMPRPASGVGVGVGV